MTGILDTQPRTHRRGACTIDGCDRLHKARGWCKPHYEQAKRRGLCRIDQPATPAACAVTDCARRRARRDWCELHYGRWLRTGTTSGGTKPPLPTADLHRLRASVGIPPEGPTEDQIRRWHAEEALDDELQGAA